jgi:hypothetical protein
LPGGAFRSSRTSAASSNISLRRATLNRSAGKPLRISSLKTASVALSLKLLIMIQLYHGSIRFGSKLYQLTIQYSKSSQTGTKCTVRGGLVSGHGSHTTKLLPPLTITQEDCNWIETAFDAVIADSHKVPGAIWSLGKTLVDNAVRKSA